MRELNAACALRTSGTGTAVAVVALLSTVPPVLHAQTVTGQLLDVETGQPIDLGLVVMLGESGDSVASTITSPDGSFSVSSSQPGTFTLLASAWGYPETTSDAFALGRGERTSVALRLQPEPLPLEEIFVGVERPTFDHPLVRNGFVRRYRRGLGHFITPHDIRNSPARTTEALFIGVPGVLVSSAGAVITGERVRMLNATGTLCYPAVYVDGIRNRVDPWSGITLSMVAPRHTIEAVEVYRRPAEIPVEYGVTQGSLGRRGTVPMGGCGVVLFWTKQGPAFGTAAGGGGGSAAVAVPGAAGLASAGSLPPVDDVGPPPVPGERIRVDLSAGAAADAGLASPWEGTFVGVRADELVTGDPERLERPVTVPLGEVEALQVLREREHGHVVRRGLVAGALFGGGVWLALRTLCRWNGCLEGGETLPAAGLGLLVGLMVAGQGPGEQWVAAPVPGPEGGLGAGLSGRFALPRR